jgi:hypothetical protein
MSELLILLTLSWFVRNWFAGVTREDVEDFLMCEKVAGEDMREG